MTFEILFGIILIGSCTTGRLRLIKYSLESKNIWLNVIDSFFLKKFEWKLLTTANYAYCLMIENSKKNIKSEVISFETFERNLNFSIQFSITFSYMSYSL